MSSDTIKSHSPRKAFWGVAVFYLVITLEFLYMASPFAAYFYSVYGPGLNFIHESPTFSWLCSLFLPHIVAKTDSVFLDARNLLGGMLAFLGFVAFLVGAAQVYSGKLTKKGPATGGVYNVIRHPQYTSLSICGFGLLLLWPRYLVLLSFIAMLFVYYFLARFEEAECEQKYGVSYREYKRRTRMFVPFRVPGLHRLPGLSETKPLRYLTVLLSYAVISGTALLAAQGLKSWSLNHLYSLYTDDAAYVSLGKSEPAFLAEIVRIAISDVDVRAGLERNRSGAAGKFINYVMPAGWYVSEIPMHRVEGAAGGHHCPEDYEKDAYRIVFTRAQMGAYEDAKGKEILLKARNTAPIMEVLIDLSLKRVAEIKAPVSKRRYEGIPLPLY